MGYCTSCGTQVTAGAQYCANCGAAVSGPGGPRTGSRPSAETIATQEQRLLALVRQATLGEYEILAEIGKGGMAVVYLGHDLALDRKVAIKVMSPALTLMDRGIQERFKREARTAAALSHPNIIPVYAVKESKELVYFVMKYIAGRSLESVIREVGPLPIPVVRTVLAQVGSAVGYAHRRGIIHRDLKPGNVMLDEEGWVVVADFGIAKVAEAEALTVTGGMVGTPAYMSPEQCGGGEVMGASDQYSLGVMAYEMITGRQPFQSGTVVNLIYDHCHTPPPLLLERRPECPPELAAVVMRMLEKDAAQRWPSVEDAVAAIGAASETDPDAARTQLSTFVRPGSAESLLEKFRTPGSPIPRSGTARRAATPLDSSPAPPPASTPRTPTASPAPHPSAPKRPARATLTWALPVAGALAVVGWLAFGKRETSDARPPAPAPVTSSPTVARLDLTPLSLALEPGQPATLQVTARDAEGRAIAEATVTWESSDPQVATVSREGVVLAVRPGTAQLTARTGASSAAAVVTVTPPAAAPVGGGQPAAVASLTIEPASAALSVGETVRLRALPRDAAGRQLPGRPVRWSVEDSGIVSVSADGVVTGRAAGTARVAATAGGQTAIAIVTAAAAPAATIDLAPSSGSIQVGASLQLRATVRDRSGAALEDRPLAWRSSDPQTANVSSSGVVTGARAGTVTITATSGQATASASVTVEAPAPVTRAVDPRPAIEAALEAYRRAIESRDLAQLRAAYPGLTREQERAWRDFFASVTELAATLKIQSLDTLGDQAQARLAVTYEYRSGTRQTQNLELTAILERRPNGWQLMTIR